MKFFLHKGIFLGFVINILVVIALGWTAIKRVQIKNDLRSLQLHKDEVVMHVEKTSAAISRLQNNAKGYAITQNEKYLEKYESLTYAIENNLEELKKIINRNTTQEENVNTLEELTTRKIHYHTQLIDFVKFKDFESAKKTFSIEEDLKIDGQIVKVSAAIETDENDFFMEQQNKKESAENIFRIAFIILFCLSIILLCVVLFILRKHLEEIKASKNQLEENQELLESIVENTSLPISIKNMKGEYLMANEKFQSLVRDITTNVKGKTDKEIFSKELAEQIRLNDLEVIKSEKEQRFEEVFPHFEEPHTYLVTKFPIKDVQKKIFAIVSIATDITERKKRDIELRESETMVQTLFDSAPDAVIVINEDSEIIKWNNRAEELFKWKEEEVLGKRMYDIIMPYRYREMHQKGIKHFLETGEGPILNKTIEVSAINKNNDEFEIEITVSANKIKEKYLFTAFLREITKRKNAERENLQNKNFLNSIIENIPDMIAVKDIKDLRYISINKAGEKLLGLKREELLGKNDYDFLSKEQADAITGKDKEVLAKGDLVDIPEELIKTKTEQRWLHTKKIPLKDEKGNPTFLLGISEDITANKHLESEKEAAEKMLRESEERMALILDNIGEGVIVTDNKQNVLLSNHMAIQMLGINDFAKLATWTEKYEIYYPDGRTVFPAQNLPIEKALKGEYTNDLELLFHDPSTGENKLLNVNGRPITDENDYIIAAVTTIKDITKYKEMEKNLKETESKYRKLIGFGRE